MTRLGGWLAVGAIAVAGFAVTQGPTVAALLAWDRGAPPPTVGYYNVQDTPFYMSLMEQARRNPSLLLDNRFSPEPSAPLLMPYWAALGTIGRLLNASTVAVYLAATLLLGSALLFGAYAFAAVVVGPRGKIAAATFVAAAGGVGWVGGLAWMSKPELEPALRGFFPDWFYAGPTWSGVLASSSHPFAATLMLLGLLSLMLRRPGPVAATLAFALALTLGILHPYGIALVVAAAVALPLASWAATGSPKLSTWVMPAAAVAGEALAAAYYWWSMGRDSGLSSWYSQNVIPSPNLLGLLLGYLPLVPLATLGVRTLWRRWRVDAASRLLLVWLALPVAMAYLPVPFQRRFLDGYYVPVGLAAAVGWASWATGWRALRYTVAAALAASLSLTPLLRSAAQVDRLANWRTQATTVTLDEAAAVGWVGGRCAAGEAALADRVFLRLWVPYLTPQCSTDAAHPHLSRNFYERSVAVAKLFGGSLLPDGSRGAWLESFGARVRYVISTDPTWIAPPFMAQAASFGSVRVFEVGP